MPGFYAANLPAFRVPGPIDFSPVADALDDYRREREKNRLLGESRAIGSAALTPLRDPSAMPSPSVSSIQETGGGQTGNRLLGGAMSNYGQSIAALESGGERNPYAARGPIVRSGDRAYGKYQVMGANVGPWTREILGREMTPEQFAADSIAQEKVFAGKFGQYVEKYGSPEAAASVWFTGRPSAPDAQARDANGRPFGLTGQQYVDRFKAGLPAETPASIAPVPQSAAVQASAPQPGGLNYDAAIRVALSQGNLAAAAQLRQQQAAEESAGRERELYPYQIRQAQLAERRGAAELENLATAQMGKIANTIQSAPEAARASMWQKVLQSHPDMAAALTNNGVDPRDIAAGTNFFVRMAGGGTDKLVEVAPGAALYNPRTQQAEFIAPEKSAPEKRLELPKFTQSLRKEYADLSKNYRAIQEGADRVKVGAELNNAVGDLSLIFGYMKLLDPGSVVREGEFANAENAQGVPDRVRNVWNKIVNGERLTSGMRQEFVAAASALANQQTQRQDRIDSQFREMATRAGINPDEVLMDFGANPAPDTQQNQPAKVTTKAEYDALPSGAVYIPPDGSQPRVKP